MKVGLWLVVAAVSGCTFDAADTCGPAMRFEPAQAVCVCDDDAVAVAGACVPCAADEIVVGGMCACPPDEMKSSNGVCVRTPGLGVACDATATCDDATYDYCATRDDAGTCTKQCAIDTDCPDTYVCADWEAIPSCRTYTGYGAACVTDECASFDANFCIMGHCEVHGCTVGVDDCPRDTACCDLSSYGIGTLCVPPGTCP